MLPIMEFPTEPATVRASLAVAMLVGLLAWETAYPFFNLFARGDQGGDKRGRHGIINLGIGLLNGLLVAGLFVSLWMSETFRKSSNTQACPACGRGDHADDASHCKFCGEKL